MWKVNELLQSASGFQCAIKNKPAVDNLSIECVLSVNLGFGLPRRHNSLVVDGHFAQIDQVECWTLHAGGGGTLGMCWKINR